LEIWKTAYFDKAKKYEVSYVVATIEAQTIGTGHLTQNCPRLRYFIPESFTDLNPPASIVSMEEVLAISKAIWIRGHHL
jgi:hypothetical protein